MGLFCGVQPPPCPTPGDPKCSGAAPAAVASCFLVCTLRGCTSCPLATACRLMRAPLCPAPCHPALQPIASAAHVRTGRCLCSDPPSHASQRGALLCMHQPAPGPSHAGAASLAAAPCSLLPAVLPCSSPEMSSNRYCTHCQPGGGGAPLLCVASGRHCTATINVRRSMQGIGERQAALVCSAGGCPARAA